MKKDRFILLSFDVEEFDLPLEYKQTISLSEQLEVGKAGLDITAAILHDFKIPCTLFTTANFAIYFPESIAEMALHHEIASHTYYHNSFKEADLLLSKQKLEEIAGTMISGLRMPRMQPLDMKAVKAAGYDYDASVNPTLIPGRYNNFHLPRTIYREYAVTRLPASVTPNVRIPLFWLAFKNFPYSLFKKLAIQTLRHDGYICLYFHPWEFTNISSYLLPGYIKNICGIRLQNMLRKLISDLQKEGEFITIRDYLQKSPV